MDMNCITTLNNTESGADSGALFRRPAIAYACEYGAGLIGRREEPNQ
jgi:hypothetical protein